MARIKKLTLLNNKNIKFIIVFNLRNITVTLWSKNEDSLEYQIGIEKKYLLLDNKEEYKYNKKNKDFIKVNISEFELVVELHNIYLEYLKDKEIEDFQYNLISKGKTIEFVEEEPDKSNDINLENQDHQ